MPGFCWTLDLLKFPPGLSLFPKLSVSFKLGRGGRLPGLHRHRPISWYTFGLTDKVIIGKEISKSIRCFQKTQTFRVYDPSSV